MITRSFFTKLTSNIGLKTIFYSVAVKSPFLKRKIEEIGTTMTPGDEIRLKVEENYDGLRLDAWLAEVMHREASRSMIQKWIKKGAIAGPQNQTRASTKVQADEEYRIIIPEYDEPDLTPTDLSIDIVYEDEYIAVLHKPAGIAVHPGPSDRSTTIVNDILYKWKHLAGGPEQHRPGIVHRLDKPTEGLLVIAKTENAHRLMAEIFQKREVIKEYAAWLINTPDVLEDTIDAAIKRNRVDRLKMKVDPSGRTAQTEYHIQESIVSRKGRKFAFADIRIHTGRTHQIRVHMAHIGCPVVGDNLYSRSAKEFEKYGLLLLAKRLAFTHPITGKDLDFRLDLPERFERFEKNCRNY